MDSEIDDIMNAWKQGDADRMAKTLFRDLGSEPMMRPFYSAIFFNRNKAMAKKIEGFLKSDKDHLVLVGAGHLVGPKSVIDFLAKKGFKTVQQLGQQ